MVENSEYAMTSCLLTISLFLIVSSLYMIDEITVLFSNVILLYDIPNVSNGLGLTCVDC